MAPNSVVPFHPSVVSPAFNFLLEPQPEPSWGPERVLVDRAEQIADLSSCQLCGRNCLAPIHRQQGFAWRDSEISAWTIAFGTETARAYREEERQGLKPDSSRRITRLYHPAWTANHRVIRHPRSNFSGTLNAAPRRAARDCSTSIFLSQARLLDPISPVDLLVKI